MLGFDPQSLSDQELLEKQLEIYKRLVWATKFSSSGALVEQLQNMADMCVSTYNERMNRKMFDLIQGNRPDAVDICAEKKPAPTKVASKARSMNRNTLRKERTSAPIKDK